MKSLRHRESLLESLSAQLKEYGAYKLDSLQVELFADGILVKTFLGLQPALHALVNSLYWDESDNWGKANSLKVGTY